jgi:predicted permease
MDLAQLNRRDVGLGALVAIVIALPCGLLAQSLADGDDDGSGRSAAVPVLFVMVMAAFGLGGWVAARFQRDTPQMHGAVAALAAFVVIQGVGVARRVAAGDGVNVASIVFFGLLAATCGLLGGWLARRRHDRDR